MVPAAPATAASLAAKAGRALDRRTTCAYAYAYYFGPGAGGKPTF
jgi:hypothetical protein